MKDLLVDAVYTLFRKGSNLEDCIYVVNNFSICSVKINFRSIFYCNYCEQLQ